MALREDRKSKDQQGDSSAATRAGDTVTRTRFHWQRWLLFVLFAVTAVAAVMFAIRTYRSFLLLRSAYELGAADAAGVRPWMTLDYVARTYGVPEPALVARLGLPKDTNAESTLRALAERQGMSPFAYLHEVQEAISKGRPISQPTQGEPMGDGATALSDELLAALLVYGYPVLALTLMLGAFGVPFPSALSVVVAGSLAAQGQMSWFWAGAIAVASSVLGDLAGYGLGQVLGREFFERRGRWLGLTPSVRARIELFFEKWGALTVVLSRSLLSFKSSAVNLLAGASRYRLRAFLPFAIVGRGIWTSAYLSLGYGFGVAIEAAADFTSSLGGLLVSLVVLAALGFMIQRNRVRPPRTHYQPHVEYQ